MARKGKRDSSQELEGTGETSMDIVLTPEHMKMIQSLVYSMEKIRLDNEALAEDVKAVAQKMNVKPGEVKEMISWIIQEQKKGGVLTAKEKKLDLARQVLSFFDVGGEAAAE